MYRIKRGLCPLAHVHPPVKHFSSLHLSCLLSFTIFSSYYQQAGVPVAMAVASAKWASLSDYSKCIFTCITYVTPIITNVSQQELTISCYFSYGDSLIWNRIFRDREFIFYKLIYILYKNILTHGCILYKENLNLMTL